MDLFNYLKYLSSFIKEEVKKANASGVVFGISGGIDSAVLSSIAKTSFPKKHLGLIMPCFSAKIDEELVLKHCKQKDINYKIINLDNSFIAFKESLQFSDFNNHILGNIKARMRMNTLYAYANKKNYLVLGSSNANEWYSGYFTKYGDGAADLLPLIYLVKKDIKAAASFFNITKEIIEREPTAGLYLNQTDEKELGLSYEEFDNYLLNKKVKFEIEQKIEKLHQKSFHKRSNAILPKKYN